MEKTEKERFDEMISKAIENVYQNEHLLLMADFDELIQALVHARNDNDELSVLDEHLFQNVEDLLSFKKLLAAMDVETHRNYFRKDVLEDF